MSVLPWTAPLDHDLAGAPASLLRPPDRDSVFAPGSETACQVKRTVVLEPNGRTKSVTDQCTMDGIET